MMQMCVSSIETSSPAKYSMISLLFAIRKAYQRPERSRQPLPDVEKLVALSGAA
jgi:hypothetical protein